MSDVTVESVGNLTDFARAYSRVRSGYTPRDGGWGAPRRTTPIQEIVKNMKSNFRNQRFEPSSEVLDEESEPSNVAEVGA